MGRDGYGDEKVVQMWNEALHQVSAENWKNYVRHTEDIIKDYWTKELLFDRTKINPIIINTGEDSDTDDIDKTV